MNKVLMLLLLTTVPFTAMSKEPISGAVSAEKSELRNVDSIFMKSTQQRFSLIAEKIGISEESYLYASIAYMRIFSEESIEGLTKIQNRELYQSLLGKETDSEFSSSYVRLNNEIKSDLASFLQLDVTKLDKFIEVVHSLHYTGEFEDVKVNSNLNKTSDVEISAVGEMVRIPVVCDEVCQSGARQAPFNPFGSTMPLNMYIYNKASSQGIIPNTVRNPNSTFTVKFVDNNTGDTIAAEVWSYNDFTGAWKVSNAPCGNCHSDR
ncbi:hypothetical protein [Shewanella sp. ISTPL2]|uniref:hypothetical protein n=1 Tax=Shewanella sp. ISTPL2 TaxID=2699425 RepID=UPI001568C817|nr:hypothetical protein [Shewanella sp. ISTPL2]